MVEYKRVLISNVLIPDCLDVVKYQGVGMEILVNG